MRKMTTRQVLTCLALVLLSALLISCCEEKKWQPRASYAHPYTAWFSLESSGPPTWKYRVEVVTDSRLPEWNGQIFKPGDIIRIAGAGVTSASVTGDAALPEFGAWRVKRIYDKGVDFEPTQEATVYKPFSGFLITAPETIEGTVKWLAQFQYHFHVLTPISDLPVSQSGSVLGPVGE